MFHFSQPNLMERPFCIHTAPLPLTALCYRSGSKIINNPGFLQASWTWQTFPPHFLPLPLQLLFHTSHRPLKPTLENHLRGPRLRWHAVILQVSPIRTPDLLECRWAPSPWIHRKQKRHTGLAELLGMCMRVCACVCASCVHVFMPVCIKLLVHERVRLQLSVAAPVPSTSEKPIFSAASRCLFLTHHV